LYINALPRAQRDFQFRIRQKPFALPGPTQVAISLPADSLLAGSGGGETRDRKGVYKEKGWEEGTTGDGMRGRKSTRFHTGTSIFPLPALYIGYCSKQAVDCRPLVITEFFSQS